MSTIHINFNSPPKPVIAYNIETKETLIGESITDLARQLGSRKNTISNVLHQNSIYQKVWLIDYQNTKNTHYRLSVSENYWKNFLKNIGKKRKYIPKDKIKVAYDTHKNEYFYAKTIEEIVKYTGINRNKIRKMLKNKIYKYKNFIIYYDKDKSLKLHKNRHTCF